MIPLTASAFRQGSAKPGEAGYEMFALRARAGHSVLAGAGRCLGLRSDIRSLSPSRRSGPSQAGPTPFPTLQHRRGFAEAPGSVRATATFGFNSRWFAVNLPTITTNQRGSLSCASRFSFFPFLSFRWPVACRTPRRAAWPVRLPVLLLRMRWMKTWSQVLPSAVLPVRPPVASSWACRPATDLITACGRADTTSRTIRADRPDGLFAFRLAARSGGTACSRKSLSPIGAKSPVAL